MYYTPTIEEFHVGFEYESLFKLEDRDYWKKNNFDYHSPNILELKDIIKKGLVRVKYLDKEDIESLEFRLIKDYSVEQVYQSKIVNNTWYELDIDDKEEYPYLITITKWEDNLLTKMSDSKTLFCGKIKNKSELKQLLKQLNIDNG